MRSIKDELERFNRIRAQTLRSPKELRYETPAKIAERAIREAMLAEELNDRTNG